MLDSKTKILPQSLITVITVQWTTTYIFVFTGDINNTYEHGKRSIIKMACTVNTSSSHK